MIAAVVAYCRPIALPMTILVIGLVVFQIADAVLP